MSLKAGVFTSASSNSPWAFPDNANFCQKRPSLGGGLSAQLATGSTARRRTDARREDRGVGGGKGG